MIKNFNIFIGCDSELFTSTEKFTSACGWPAFTGPSSSDNSPLDSSSDNSPLDSLLKQSNDKGPLRYVVDNSYGMQRVEVRCRCCESHLGHVFEEPGWTRASGRNNNSNEQDDVSDRKAIVDRLRYCINGVCLDFRPNK